MTPALTDMDVEAEPREDVRVAADIVGNDFSSLLGSGWAEPLREADRSDPLMLSLEQWLGVEAVRAMTMPELEALRLSVSRLPEPEKSDSFVWDAIRQPDHVGTVAEAVVSYRRFDPALLVVAEAMGGNGHFRKFIRQSRADDAVKVSDLVAKETAAAGVMKEFMAGLELTAGAMKSFFGEREYSVSATLVAFAASEALGTGTHHYASGFGVAAKIPDDDLETLDALRRKAVVAADAVRKACYVDPLLYSRGVLGGVRRSIAEKSAGDFVFAVEGLGGRLESDEAIQMAGRSFLMYLAAVDTFAASAEALGVTQTEERALMARLLLRRHLKSAARILGVDWNAVRDELDVLPDMKRDDVTAFIETMSKPGLSGRLVVACKDRSRPLSDVAKAAYRASVSREYVIEGGRRASATEPEVTVGQVRKAIDAEPSIEASREVLKAFGAVSRHDVDQLERHLEWMISAYALPVPDEAVSRIVETKADIIPLRLANAA